MYKKLKPCPNSGVRCGKSSACFPKGTICKEDKVLAVTKPKSVSNNYDSKKIEASTTKFPWKSIVAASSVITIAGGSLLYLKTREKVLYPHKLETTKAPDNLTHLNNTLDLSKLPVDNYGADENQSMFATKKKRLGETSEITIDRGYNDTVTKTVAGTNNLDHVPYDEDTFRDNQSKQKLYNHKLARKWAFDVLNDPDTIILDLETTSLLQGLDPYSPESYRKVRTNVPGIFQIGLLEAKSYDSLDIRLNPEKKLSNIAQEVTNNNGKNLNKYVTFKDYYPKLNELLQNKKVLAFNARFDMSVIDALCEENNLPLIKYKNRPIPNEPMNNDADVMHWYALYMGKGARSDFKDGKYEPLEGLAYASLPKLPGQKAHDARSDCWSTLDVLRVMANGEKPRDMKVEESKAWSKLFNNGTKNNNSLKPTNDLNNRNSVNKVPPKSLMEPSKVVTISEADTLLNNALNLADNSKKFKASSAKSYDAYSTWGTAPFNNGNEIEADVNNSKAKRSSAKYTIKPLISDSQREEDELKSAGLRQYIDKYNKKANTIINEALS